LFSSAKYNWTTHKTSTSWQLLNVASGNVTEAPFDSEVSEVVWVGASNTSIVYINATNEEVPGGVTLYTADVGADPFSPYAHSEYDTRTKCSLNVEPLSHLSTRPSKV
jgi:hypothetical protein